MAVSEREVPRCGPLQNTLPPQSNPFPCPFVLDFGVSYVCGIPTTACISERFVSLFVINVINVTTIIHKNIRWKI